MGKVTFVCSANKNSCKYEHADIGSRQCGCTRSSTTEHDQINQISALIRTMASAMDEIIEMEMDDA